MKSIISVISAIKNKLVKKDNHNKTVDNLKEAFKDAKKKR